MKLSFKTNNNQSFSVSLTKNKKIHILYLVSRLNRHGPIFQLYNIVKYLDRREFYPRIVTLSPEANDSLLPVFKKIGVEYYSLGVSRMAGMIFGARKIRKLLQKNPVDLIHTSDFRSVLLCAMNFTSIPRVFTCRQAFDYTHYALHGGINPVSARVIPKALEIACRKYDRVVGVSDFVRRSADTGLAGRMVVIHNGVDQDLFRVVGKENKAAIRSKFNLPQNKHIFLTSGLSKRKDPITVIKAFLKSKVNQNAILVLLGDGTLREECSRLADAEKTIRIVGFVKNVKDYLGAADTFISASLAEGCPNAVMEAMACGLPVVLSDIPPHREILAFNEQAGLLFVTKNTASLSKMLSRSLVMDYSQQSSAALSIIRNHLNAENMSRKYQQLYTKILD
jgi:glycosyltransferase involved in cell wall biosynthesis